MHNTLKARFIAFGFKSKLAFYHICMTLDQTLCIETLVMFWEWNAFNKDIENKIETVFEKLKHE